MTNDTKPTELIQKLRNAAKELNSPWMPDPPPASLLRETADEIERLTAALTQARAVPETAWLVEWKAHGYGPQWWGFNYTPGKRGSWCADDNNAVRFARKEDAERMRLHIIAVAGLTGQHDYERSISATEHEWIDTQARAVPPNGWQWKLMPVDLSPEAAERARKDLMSVERGRKVGDLTREIRRRQMGSGVDTTALDAAPSAVPAGWKLVPVEPTPEMLEASDSHCHDDLLYPQDMLLGPRAMRTTEYRAMLAAAPSPADQPSDWRPIESAPEGLLVVVGWLDNEDDESPERHAFDVLEDGYWIKHSDHVEHAEMVAPPGSRMPPRKAPYTHWIVLPALPLPPAEKP